MRAGHAYAWLAFFEGEKVKKIQKRYPILAAIILLFAGYFGWYENDQSQDNILRQDRLRRRYNHLRQVSLQNPHSHLEVIHYVRNTSKSMALRWALHQLKNMKMPQLPLYLTAEHSISWKKKMEMEYFDTTVEK